MHRFRLHPFPIRTAKGYYLYDPCTSEFFRTDEMFYQACSEILAANDPGAAWHDIVLPPEPAAELERMQAEGFLLAHELTIEPYHPAEFAANEDLTGAARVCLIEVTEACNLACSYCSYSGQSHFRRGRGETAMAVEKLKEVVEWYLSHSNPADDRHVVFYGGEPLIYVDRVLEAVQHGRALHVGPGELSFHVSTNGVLLTPETAMRLMEQRVFIGLSLDGPKEIQDWARKDHLGHGSYDIVMRNLRWIAENYGAVLPLRLRLMITVDPHRPGTVFAAWERLMNEEPMLRRIPKRMTWIENRSTEPLAYRSFPAPDETSEMLEYARKFVGNLSQLEDNNSIPGILYNQTLNMIHNRTRKKMGSRAWSLGQCIPGRQRVFASVDGTLFPCERVDSRFTIGTIETGIEPERVRHAQHLWHKLISSTCKGCWAFRLCVKCMSQVTDADHPEAHLQNMCRVQQKRIGWYLHLYCHILENEPQLLNHFLAKAEPEEHQNA